MRIYLILNAIGLVLTCFGCVLLLPIIVAILYQDWYSILPFVISALVGIIPGVLLLKFTPNFEMIRRNEGIVITAMAWLVACGLGALPYMFWNIPLIDSLFESMSGVTTTGATILTDFSLYPKALFFWRNLSQWIGGMGIIVLFIAILPQFAVAGRQLFFAEAPGPTEDKLTPRVRHTAMRLWTIYLALTVLEVILLTLVGMPLFDSICNSLSTLSAAGFSPHPLSIMGYNNIAAEWIIIVFMFLAGANFALQYKVLRSNKPGLLFKNSEFLFYSLIFLVATVVVTFILFTDYTYNFVDSLRAGAFQVISILTTTGFASVDFSREWSDAALIVLLGLMLIGGCAGSSGGGVKVVRIFLLIKIALKEISQLIHPKAILPLKYDGQVVSREIAKQIVSFFIIYLGILVMTTILVGIIESDMLVAFTACAATIGNIGPGVGMIGPMDNYTHLHSFTKFLLIFNMWVGRLEIMTVLMFLHPYTWKFISKK